MPESPSALASWPCAQNLKQAWLNVSLERWLRVLGSRNGLPREGYYDILRASIAASGHGHGGASRLGFDIVWHRTPTKASRATTSTTAEHAKPRPARQPGGESSGCNAPLLHLDLEVSSAVSRVAILDVLLRGELRGQNSSCDTVKEEFKGGETLKNGGLLHSKGPPARLNFEEDALQQRSPAAPEPQRPMYSEASVWDRRAILTRRFHKIKCATVPLSFTPKFALLPANSLQSPPAAYARGLVPTSRLN